MYALICMIGLFSGCLHGGGYVRFEGTSSTCHTGGL